MATCSPTWWGRSTRTPCDAGADGEGGLLAFGLQGEQGLGLIDFRLLDGDLGGDGLVVQSRGAGAR